MADRTRQIDNANREAKKRGRPPKPKLNNLIVQESNREEATGEATSVCRTCGNLFEQAYEPARNRYSSFKTCLSCRNKVAAKKTKKLNEKIEEAENKNQETTATSMFSVPITFYPFQKEMYDEFQEHRFLVANCLLPDQFILGCNKRIQDIEVGDKVISNNDRLTNVYKTMSRAYNGDIYNIKGMGCLPISVTDEHPILIAKFSRNENIFGYKRGDRTHKVVNTFIEEKYMQAKDIAELPIERKQGNGIRYCLKVPRVLGNIECKGWEIRPLKLIGKNNRVFTSYFPLNNDTAWLLGLYCAEGCSERHIDFATNINDIETQNKICKIVKDNELIYHRYIRNENNCVHININYVPLAELFLSLFNDGALNKQIPNEILFNSDESILVSFLQGYYRGDGYFDTKQSKLYCKSASERLIYGIQLAWARLGHFATIQKNTRKEKSIIDGRVIKNDNPFYMATISDHDACRLLGYEARKKVKGTYKYVTEHAIYTPITSIEKSYYNGNVYNISTEDETYCVNSVISHNCGNRTGKDIFTTVTGIMYYIEILMENRHIYKPELTPSAQWWMIAPTEAIGKTVWRLLTNYMPKELVVASSSSTMTMQTVGNGIIEVKSAFDPQSLVSTALDLVTITEAARIADLEAVWSNLQARLTSQGRGRLQDRNGKDYGRGKAIINSSPLGKNFFYTMWTWGQKNHNDYNSEYVSFTFPWTANPAMEQFSKELVDTRYGKITQEERLRREGERLYLQNYMADFLAGDGSVFKNFDEKSVTIMPNSMSKTEKNAMIKEWQKPKPYAKYLIGYDPAADGGGDSPVLIIRDKDTGNVVRVIEMYGLSYDNQWDTIAQYSKMYNYAPCAYGITGHTPISGQLEKRGVLEIPLNEQGNNKEVYINALSRAIDNDMCHVLMDNSKEVHTLIMQVNDYTAISSKRGGKTRYSNSQQPHDDFVSAMYFAFHDFELPSLVLPYVGAIEMIEYDDLGNYVEDFAFGY